MNYKTGFSIIILYPRKLMALLLSVHYNLTRRQCHKAAYALEQYCFARTIATDNSVYFSYLKLTFTLFNATVSLNALQASLTSTIYHITNCIVHFLPSFLSINHIIPCLQPCLCLFLQRI